MERELDYKYISPSKFRGLLLISQRLFCISKKIFNSFCPYSKR